MQKEQKRIKPSVGGGALLASPQGFRQKLLSILGCYCTNTAGSIVLAGESKPSPEPSPIGEGDYRHSEGACRSTRQIEFCINFSRHSEPTGERIQPMMADGGQEVLRSGDLEGKKIGSLEDKLFTLNSLSSNPPTLLFFMKKLDCFGSKEPRNDMESLCKAGLSDAAATLPLQQVARKKHFTLHRSLKRNAAFTLAEVLITLGIIGVVAALTMPSLIANYQKSQFEAGVKKMASVVGQAATKLMADEGVSKITETSLLYHPTDDWDTMCKLGGEFLDKYFNVVDKCETYEKCFGETYKHADKDYADTFEFGGYSADACRILADGVSICAVAGDSSYYAADFNFDLNGPKGPNKQGYDLFYFSVYYDGSISEVPPECRKDAAQCNGYTPIEKADLCKNGEVSGYGAGCFMYLQRNGFKIDY